MRLPGWKQKMSRSGRKRKAKGKDMEKESLSMKNDASPDNTLLQAQPGMQDKSTRGGRFGRKEKSRAKNGAGMSGEPMYQGGSGRLDEVFSERYVEGSGGHAGRFGDTEELTAADYYDAFAANSLNVGENDPFDGTGTVTARNDSAIPVSDIASVIEAQQVETADDDGMKTVRMDERDHTMEVGLASHIGARNSQQDAAVASYEHIEGDTRVIAILCDGMGGMEQGEIASTACVQMIFDDYTAHKGSLESVPDFLIEEAVKADEKISSLVDETGNALESGCTLLAVIIRDRKMYWVSVGDSRIYILRKNTMLQITTDHNYMLLLNEKVKNGEMSMEEALKDPQKDALVSYIGMCGLKYIDSNKKAFELFPDDFLLMCSDGLYRTLDTDDMKKVIINNYNNMALAAQKLVDTAVCSGNPHQDNTSAVLIKCV